ASALRMTIKLSMPALGVIVCAYCLLVDAKVCHLPNSTPQPCIMYIIKQSVQIFALDVRSQPKECMGDDISWEKGQRHQLPADVLCAFVCTVRLLQSKCLDVPPDSLQMSEFYYRIPYGMPHPFYYYSYIPAKIENCSCKWPRQGRLLSLPATLRPQSRARCSVEPHAANVAVESLDGGAETDAAGDDEAPPASADSGTAVLPISPSGDPALEGIDEPLPEMPQLIPASIWTRQNIAEFKKEILRDSKHCCIKIGSLATATVRVPTHEEGTCIVWEFATDHYDLGFGVYFEWTITPSDKVTVQISESSDEEDDDEGEDGEAPRGEGDVERPDDPERGSRRRRDDDKSIDEIIPVYRRDCHEEVYCGSHQYPGRGVYLLKFDNSYSLWRSKWLYYRPLPSMRTAANRLIAAIALLCFICLLLSLLPGVAAKLEKQQPSQQKQQKQEQQQRVVKEPKQQESSGPVKPEAEDAAAADEAAAAASAASSRAEQPPQESAKSPEPTEEAPEKFMTHEEVREQFHAAQNDRSRQKLFAQQRASAAEERIRVATTPDEVAKH
uniref:GOLD domain-containing protein n=1 Tax=Macrostomum lignano TaxID=282301 RepID=A0A1I8IFM0_9PLAT